MYSFTDRELAEELASLSRKGVRVRVYRDREQLEQEMQRDGVNTTLILLAAGIEVRVKGARDLMHLKSYAIDGRLLRTGSAHWSPTGLKRDDNNVRYESSPAVKRFERNLRRCGTGQGTPIQPTRPDVRECITPSTKDAVGPLFRPELAFVLQLPLEGMGAIPIGAEQLRNIIGREPEGSCIDLGLAPRTAPGA